MLIDVIDTVLRKYKNAKRIAVENFCLSADINEKAINRANLQEDARRYKWNEETQKAITEILKLK